MSGDGPETELVAGFLGSGLVPSSGMCLGESSPGVRASTVDGSGAFENLNGGGKVVDVAVEGGEVEAGGVGGPFVLCAGVVEPVFSHACGEVAAVEAEGGFEVGTAVCVIIGCGGEVALLVEFVEIDGEDLVKAVAVGFVVVDDDADVQAGEVFDVSAGIRGGDWSGVG